MTDQADDFIQRLPAPGDRWRGLSNQELADVMVALEADGDHYTRPEDRERVEALWRDADAELTRRDAQPKDD
ncbi:MAG: hypothetical protein ACJ780_10135 [Solirubrobacteraceae bacterium]|jgi:hypothetical protein